MNLWQKMKLGLSILIGKTSIPILDEIVRKNSTLNPKVEVVPSKSIPEETAEDYEKRLFGNTRFAPDIMKEQKVLVQPRHEHITLVPLLFPIKEIMIGEHLIPLLRDYTKTRIQQERTHVEVVADEGENNSPEWMNYECVTVRTLSEGQRSSIMETGWVPELITNLEITRKSNTNNDSTVVNKTVSDEYPNLKSRTDKEQSIQIDPADLCSYTPETFYKKSHASIDSFTKPFIEHLRPVLVDMCRISLTEKSAQNMNILRPSCDTIDEVNTKIGRGCSSSFMMIDVPKTVIVGCISKMNHITYEELEKLRLEKYND